MSTKSKPVEAMAVVIERGFNMRELIDGWRSLKLDLDRRKAEYEASIEEDKLALANLEGWIKDELHEKGIQSIKISDPDAPDYLRGTVYLSKRVGSKVDNAEDFFGYVMKTGQTELLFARANEKAVEEFIEAHKAPPPGVTINTTERLNFRKAS